MIKKNDDKLMYLIDSMMSWQEGRMKGFSVTLICPVTLGYLGSSQCSISICKIEITLTTFCLFL